MSKSKDKNIVFDDQKVTKALGVIIHKMIIYLILIIISNNQVISETINISGYCSKQNYSNNSDIKVMIAKIPDGFSTSFYASMIMFDRVYGMNAFLKNNLSYGVEVSEVRVVNGNDVLIAQTSDPTILHNNWIEPDSTIGVAISFGIAPTLSEVENYYIDWYCKHNNEFIIRRCYSGDSTIYTNNKAKSMAKLSKEIKQNVKIESKKSERTFRKLYNQYSDSTITDYSGYYMLENDPCIYNIKYSYDNFFEKINEEMILVTDTILQFVELEENLPPSIEISELPDAMEDQSYEFHIDGNDPNEMDTIKYELNEAPSWLSIDEKEGILSGIPRNEDVAENILIIMSVKDLFNAKDSIRTHINVINTNDSPMIITTELDDAFEDQEYSVTIEATDPDIPYGDHMTYSLTVYPEGMTINSSTGEINWLPDNDDVGDTTVTVVVTDDSSATDTQSFILTVTNVNDPPVFTSIPDTSFNEDNNLLIPKSYFYDYVDDPDNYDSTLTFTFNNEDHVYVNTSIDSIRLSSPLNWNGYDTIEVIVNDGNLYDTTSWNINVNPVNDAPVICSADSVSAIEDVYFKYNAETNDIDNSSVNYIFENLPVWLTSNADSIYGTPVEGSRDTSFNVIASDGELYDTLNVLLSVIAINDPPVLLSIPDTSFFEDCFLALPVSYFYQFVNDPDNPDSTLLWSISDTDYVSVNIRQDSVIYSAGKDWFGADTLFLNVSDGEFSDKTDFIIDIYPINDPPYFTEFMPDSISFDSDVCDTLFLDGLASDIDDQDSTLIWSYIHSSFISSVINDTLKCATFWVEENISGQDTVIFSISDGEYILFDSLIVIVNQVLGLDFIMSQIPQEYYLAQNYPNPFNPITNIIYGIPKRSFVTIKIYDLLGKEIITLVNKNQEAKYYKILWDAKDKFGNNVSSGMYFCRIIAESDNNVFTKTKKLLLLR